MCLTPTPTDPTAASTASSGSPRQLRAGAELSGYRIDGLLGCGGMATVYCATQLSLHRRVALKVLAEDRTTDPCWTERFRREALMQAQLDHPNVVEVYEAGVAGGAMFIAMRLVRGTTLRARLRAGGLTGDHALRLLAPIAEALDAAHARGLVHRDVKPENILVCWDGHPYIADFGIAHARLQAGITGPGGILGTPGYIAPELLAGTPPGPAADVYAFAAVLQECLRAADGAPPAPGVRRALERGMAFAPGDRPAGVGDLLDEVRRARRGRRRGPSAVADARRRPSHAPPLRPHRRPRLRQAVGCCVATSLAIAGWTLGIGRTDPSGLVLGAPMVTPMTRADFLREHRLGADRIALRPRAAGVAVEANVREAGPGDPVEATCTVRDLVTGSAVSDLVAQVGPPSGAGSSTVPCWVGLRLVPGRPYRATLRLWRPGQPPVLLVTVVRDFVLR